MRSRAEADEDAHFLDAIRAAARLVVDNPKVRTLVSASIMCEIFGFSFLTAVPVFARDVLSTGAEGLGTLNAATSLGGSLAVAALALVPARLPREPLLGGVFAVYGVAMICMSMTHTLPAAVLALLVIGACAASFDVLQQTLMQLAVPEHQRGRAVGVWVFGIGSAPIGHLEMGSLAAVLGAPGGPADQRLPGAARRGRAGGARAAVPIGDHRRGAMTWRDLTVLSSVTSVRGRVVVRRLFWRYDWLRRNNLAGPRDDAFWFDGVQWRDEKVVEPCGCRAVWL